MTKKKTSELSEERQARKELAESDLEEFIRLVHPKRMLGNIHRHVIRWWTRSEAKEYQLLLLPRDHMKSALVAYRVAWELTKDPTLRILFISSTSNLATKQLKFIKDILTCDTYRIYWPDMVHEDDAKREKWTEREISIDHPLRKDESIRDPSIFTAGLTSNIVGMHCDIAVLDDVVVQGNAYSEDGRQKVKEQYGYLSSIAGANSRVWVVGTRYHPQDLYQDLMQMQVDVYDKNGEVVRREDLFEKMEEQVESVGDGTGQFLWPKQQRSDGRWFGFDQEILSKKRASYINKTHFRAQYYNDPQDTDSSVFSRNQFQYYEPGFLSRKDGRWFFKGKPLNVVAAIDFAYTLGKKSDFSAIVVLGMDGDMNYYVLEIDRFKTDLISDYFKHILKMHEKWGFRKIRAEIVSAQTVIVKDLKENYIRKNGISLSVEEFLPTRNMGAKEIRIESSLQPKYENLQMWHYPGGNCQLLEEELLFVNPAHDDIKDALASAVDFAIPPLNLFTLQKAQQPQFTYHRKFGGVA